MAVCEVCGKSDQFLFDCQFCGGEYCTSHQSPGEHLCGEAPPVTRILEDRPTPAVAEPEAPAEPPTAEPTEASPSQTPPEPEQEPVLRAKTLAVIVAVLLASSAVGGYAVLGTGLPAGLEPDLSEFTGDQSGDVTTAVPADELNRSTVERMVVNRINAIRANRGMAPFVYDPRLAEIAEFHSEDMAANNYTSHLSPDGATTSDRFSSFGYRCDAPGEIILFTLYGSDVDMQHGMVRFGTEAELAGGIVDLWLQSEPHRRALLTQSWTAVGVGVVVDDDNRVYATLNGC